MVPKVFFGWISVDILMDLLLLDAGVSKPLICPLAERINLKPSSVQTVLLKSTVSSELSPDSSPFSQSYLTTVLFITETYGEISSWHDFQNGICAKDHL